MKRVYVCFLLIVTLLGLTSCGEDRHRYRPSSLPERPYAISGLASYYSDALHGRQTANGERYNREAFTAAHRTLPFGTLIQVTNKRNGKSIVVRINDRGPYVDGRVIDLSWRAAQSLGMVAEGVVPVKLDPVD